MRARGQVNEQSPLLFLRPCGKHLNLPRQARDKTEENTMVFHTAFLDGTLPLLKQQLAVRKRLSCVILYLTLIRFFRRQAQDEHGKSVYKKRRFRRAQASGSRTASPQSHTTPTLHTRKTLTSGRTPDLPVALLRWAAQHRAAALRRWRALSTSMCRERLSFKASAEIDAFLHGSFAGNPIVCQDRLRINNRKRLKTAFLQASAGRLRHGNAVAPWLTRSGSTGPRPGR
jgi:hypothetical protein